MSLIVQKYGGTSVGTPERILNVAKRILQTQAAGNQVVAVVSAMSGATDNLIKLARQVAPHPTEREMDVLLSTGDAQCNTAPVTLLTVVFAADK
jgi:aspartate kinase